MGSNSAVWKRTPNELFVDVETYSGPPPGNPATTAFDQTIAAYCSTNYRNHFSALGLMIRQGIQITRSDEDFPVVSKCSPGEVQGWNRFSKIRNR